MLQYADLNYPRITLLYGVVGSEHAIHGKRLGPVDKLFLRRPHSVMKGGVSIQQQDASQISEIRAETL